MIMCGWSMGPVVEQSDARAMAVVDHTERARLHPTPWPTQSRQGVVVVVLELVVVVDGTKLSSHQRVI